MESVKTVNSFLRTIVAMAAVGLVSLLSWLGYQNLNKDEIALKKKEAALTEVQQALDEQRTLTEQANRQLRAQAEEITTLNADVAAKAEEIAQQLVEIERLDTALNLLKVDHRLAEVTVLEQGTDEATDRPYSVIEFVEVNDEGAPIEKPKQFRIIGKEIFIYGWVVKFEDKYVENSDLDRSTSIFLFRSIFGELPQESEGFPLDKSGARPTAYVRGQESEFEKNIWDDFWSISNNPAKAKELGIRAAHGNAVSFEPVKGKKYKVELRASDGVTIKPVDVPLSQAEVQ